MFFLLLGEISHILLYQQWGKMEMKNIKGEKEDWNSIQQRRAFRHIFLRKRNVFQENFQKRTAAGVLSQSWF